LNLKKRYVLLGFITVLLLLGLIRAWFIKSPLVESSSIEKIGKIKDISHWEFAEPNKPSSTGLILDDGDVLVFKGVIENIEIGKTYRVTFHGQHQIILGPDHPVGLHGGRSLEWSGEYYILDSIEEV